MPINIQPTQVSSYLQYLPAIFQEDMTFIGRFLLAFEKILSGLGDPGSPGLEEIIAGIDTYFKPGPVWPGENPPARTPDNFLPWLASWVALTLRADWDPEEQRRFISRIVPLYRKRGTKAGMEEMLRTYTGMGVEVLEHYNAFVVGETSIGGGPPHFFRVKMVFTDLDPAFERRERIARAIIDQEKPAHTYYHLEVVLPTMQIGVHSTVGEDTLLGTTKEKSQP